MRIVLYPSFAPDVLAIGQRLQPSGSDLVLADVTSPVALAEALDGTEFLVGFVGPLPAEAWAAAKSLKLIQLLSAGYDSFQIDRARELGVPVATNGGANAIAVAEHAVMLMLATLRRLVPLDRDVRQGKWKQSQRGDLIYHELSGKAVGLVGMGTIGRQVVRRLRGWDVD